VFEASLNTNKTKNGETDKISEMSNDSFNAFMHDLCDSVEETANLVA